MKIITKSGDVAEVLISFPGPNQVTIRAEQDGEILGFETVSDVAASYRFLNNLEPFGEN